MVRDRVRLPRRDVLAAIALALLSGALTAVVFLLVLLLISGWSVEPLAAAAAVSVLPVAAVAGSFVRAPAATRAVAGCLLVAGGIACLALLPEASALWTIVPQLLAGVGMGMAFPALAGDLLPERTRGEAAALLSLRHAGITLALVALAPIVAAELDEQVELARERGTAVVLDSALPPTDKIAMAPRLFAEIETEDPRDALAQAVARERRRVGREDRDLLSRLEQLEGQLGADTGGLLGGLEELEDRFGGGLLDELDERLGSNTSPADLRGELDRLADELDEWCWPRSTPPSVPPSRSREGWRCSRRSCCCPDGGAGCGPEPSALRWRWRWRFRPSTRSRGPSSSPSPSR